MRDDYLDRFVDEYAWGPEALRPSLFERIANGFRLTPKGNKKPKGWKAASTSSVTGSNGLYGLYADAYRELAEELHLEPRQLQSIARC